MANGDKVQRVRIYLRERDRWEGQLLYIAVLNRLQREGATGATVLRGLIGFGPGQRLRTSGSTDPNNDAPLVIEWVDRSDRIARLLPLFDDMLPSALTTLEDLDVYRAALRSHGPFSGESSVGDYLQTEVAIASVHTPAREVLRLMLERDQRLLPVLDENRHVIGIIAGVDLMHRAGLQLAPHLLRVLSEAERAPLIEQMSSGPVSAYMTVEPRSIPIGSPVPQALVAMLEWNYGTLPVVDRSHQFVGLLSSSGVLQAALQKVTPENTNVRDAEPPTQIHLVMQVTVPHASVTQPLAAVLTQLLATPQRFLVLVDSVGRVQGTLSDVDVLHALTGHERATWLAVLLGQDLPLPGLERSPEGVMQRTFHTLAPNQSINEAITRFVTLDLERAPVVDVDGKLLGLVARGGLLRALAQAS